MADNKTNLNSDVGSFKEAVCVDVGRVYDSCCDRDCLEDLRCFFTAETQTIINQAVSVRLKKAEVLNVYIDVEPVNFNKGFYSCDLTFFFLMTLDCYTAPNTCPTEVQGITAFGKKVILFGSEGNVKVYSSSLQESNSCDSQTIGTSNNPKCVVQCVEPVSLSARLCQINDTYDCVRYFPQSIINYFGTPLETNLPTGTTTVYATLGLFTIVQLVRNVQMLIPVYDFCIPEKQCEDSTDQPCDIFRKIKFPTDDFFPPKTCSGKSGCGCQSGN